MWVCQSVPSVHNKAVLFPGVGSPEHFLAEGGEEISFCGFYHAYPEGGPAYLYGRVLRAAEAVAVDGYQETVAAAAHVKTDGLAGGKD